MDKDTLKLRWAEIAEELWALRVEASLSKSESWSEGQGPGHRARPAVVGGRMWEEMGMLVPCTAAGSWLPREGQSPRRLGGQEAAVRNGGEEGPWWTASPRPFPLPGMCRWAAAGLLEELSPGVLEVRVPEGRVPSDYGGWGLSL